VIDLSVLCSATRSGAFIAVVAEGHRTPFSPLLSPSLRPPEQIKLVVYQVSLVIRNISGDKSSTLVPLLLGGSS